MSRENAGMLVVISGFSGAGKGTVIRKLLERYPDDYALSISATTRPPRSGEREGIAYFFKTREEFERMIAQNKLIEYAQYVGNYYGTPKDYVEEQRAAGKDVILEIEIQGAKKIRECYPEAVSLFIAPPSVAELKERLAGRATEDSATIQKRLEQAANEAQWMEQYDYLVINDDLDACVEEVHQILCAEHARVSRNLPFAKYIKNEMKEFLKGDAKP